MWIINRGLFKERSWLLHKETQEASACYMVGPVAETKNRELKQTQSASKQILNKCSVNMYLFKHRCKCKYMYTYIILHRQHPHAYKKVKLSRCSSFLTSAHMQSISLTYTTSKLTCLFISAQTLRSSLFPRSNCCTPPRTPGTDRAICPASGVTSLCRDHQLPNQHRTSHAPFTITTVTRPL